MTSPITANLFWVDPNLDSEAEYSYDEFGDTLLESAISFDSFIELRRSSYIYRLERVHVNESTETVYGVVLKHRRNQLPSALADDGTSPLPINNDTDLGEPMCFAFRPKLAISAVHYSHNGPRHPILQQVVNSLGYEEAVHIYPTLRLDTIQRLENTNIVRKLEFTLKSPQAIQELRAIGRGPSAALDMKDAFGGVNVSVTVTMGHDPGTLSIDTVKNFCQRLANAGDAVSTLRIKGADGPDSELLPIDFFNDRIHESLQIEENGREIDVIDCCEQLGLLLDRQQPVIETQLRS